MLEERAIDSWFGPWCTAEIPTSVWIVASQHKSTCDEPREMFAPNRLIDVRRRWWATKLGCDELHPPPSSASAQFPDFWKYCASFRYVPV